MLGKKHNDSFYWKNKLESLNNLPGEQLIEKDVVWAKLNNRLQQKPANNKVAWYWMAASLLPIAIALFTMMYKTQDTLVMAVSKKDSAINTTTTFIPTVLKEEVAVYPLAEKKQIIRNATFKNTKPADAVTTNEEIAVVIPAQNIVTETVFSNTPQVDASINNTSVLAVKKKLQVIHVNELENYPAQFTTPVNYAQNLAETKNRKNKANNVTFTTQQNSIGFKIKLSSKN